MICGMGADAGSGRSVDGELVTVMTVRGVHIRRLNTKLEGQKLEQMTDLVKDFSNGVKLIQVSLLVPSKCES